MNIKGQKLTIALIGFTAGVFLYQYSLLFTLFLLVLSLILLKILGKRALIFTLATAMFFIGGLYTNLTERINLSKAEHIAGKTETISGVIISIPEDESYGQSAVCRTKFGKIRLMTADATLEYKDNVTFTAKSYFPAEKSRSYAFDYPLYLKSEGIYLMAFAPEIDVTGSSFNMLNPKDAITALREYCLSKTTTLWSKEPLMFARSILFGDTSLSSGAFREKLSNGSISHIIAVSGTHVSLFCAVILLIIKPFTSRKKYLLSASLPFIFFFVVITGASPSSIRAALMMAIYIISASTLSHYDPFTSLMVAAFFILAANPFTAFSLSFILSFSAVAGILIFSSKIDSCLKFIRFKKLSGMLSLTLSAQIFTLPLAAMIFGRIPFLSLLANLIAIPLVPFIMLFGYLSLLFSFLPEFYNFFVYASELLMTFSIKIAEIAASVPLSGFTTIYQSKFLIILCFIAALMLFISVLFLKSKKISIIFSSVLAVTITLNAVFPTFFGKCTVDFVDSGHGDLTLAVNKNTSLMIDCLSNETDVVNDIVLPLLYHNGFSSLDAIAVTEYNKYEENITEIVSIIKTDIIILPEGTSCENLSKYAKKHKIKLLFVSSGDRLNIGSMELYIPYSSDGICSYVLTNNCTSFLIPGNIEEKQEIFLSEAVSDCDILKSPRHGNKGSCTEELLDTVNPRAVIVSTGRNLSDNFSERLSDYDVYSTKVNGDITVKCGQNPKIIPYKKVTK